MGPEVADGSDFGFLCFMSNREMVVGQARLRGERVGVEQAYLLRSVQAQPGGVSWFIYPQDWPPTARSRRGTPARRLPSPGRLRANRTSSMLGRAQFSSCSLGRVA
jgi:hypothetical protein